MSDSETEQPTENKTADLQQQFVALQKARAQSIYFNLQWQHKAAEYYRRKKSNESQTAIKIAESNKNGDDNDGTGDMVNENNQEQRYTKYIDKLKQSKDDLKILASKFDVNNLA